MLMAVRNLGIRHEKSDAADHVTVSIGITSGKAKYLHGADDYLRSADEMLYESKKGGRNKFTFQPLKK